MKFKKFKPKVGDILEINESMSLLYEKIAKDLLPIWHEIPSVPSNLWLEEGHYVSVTPDIWFLRVADGWRVMSLKERLEATRQDYESRFTALNPE
jgi:hypothetical protein